MNVQKIIFTNISKSVQKSFQNPKFKINNDASAMNSSKIFGKHKIPRFLYHITSKENYTKMLSDGYIIPKDKDLFIQKPAVYFTDITNLLKRWSRAKDNGGGNILYMLLDHCKGSVGPDKNDIVILKIPTAKLEQEKLKIRSQNRFMAKADNALRLIIHKVNVLHLEDKKEYSNLPQSEVSALARRQAQQIMLQKADKSDYINHLFLGDNAKYSKLYKQRKEAIEYFYSEKINIKDVEKIGEATLPKDFEGQANNIFKQLLKGTKEQNALEHLFPKDL